MSSFQSTKPPTRGDNPFAALLNRGTSPLAQGSSVRPDSDADTWTDYWSEYIKQTPKMQLIDIIHEVTQKRYEKGKTPKAAEMRTELIDLLMGNQRNRTLEQQITLATRVLKDAGQMDQRSMQEIAKTIDIDKSSKLGSKSKPEILKWINDNFESLTLGKKDDVLKKRDKILSQMAADKALKDAGTSDKMTRAEDYHDDEADNDLTKNGEVKGSIRLSTSLKNDGPTRNKETKSVRKTQSSPTKEQYMFERNNGMTTSELERETPRLSSTQKITEQPPLPATHRRSISEQPARFDKEKLDQARRTARNLLMQLEVL